MRSTPLHVSKVPAVRGPRGRSCAGSACRYVLRPAAVRVAAALALFVVCAGAPAQGQTSAAAVSADSAAPAQPALEEGVNYRVYDRQGRRSSLAAIVDAARGDDVLLVGEEHDDMVGHAFQTELFRSVLSEIGAGSGSGRAVVLSLEMFERDVQYIVDEYLAGMITESHFLRSSRPWDDYRGRYRPAVELARENWIPVIAANAPRRYVNRVTNEGPESLMELSVEARAFLPPLPYPGPSATYRSQWDAIMTAAMLGASSQDGAASYEMNPNAIYAQALWDASMGHAIAEALVRHLGSFVVHFAGSFHVEKDTGIVERLADYRPGTRVTTVVMTQVDDVEGWIAEEHGTLADFVVLTNGGPAS